MNTKLSLMMYRLKYLGKSELISAIYFDACSLLWLEKRDDAGINMSQNKYNKMLIVECRWCVYENSLPTSFNRGVYLKFFTIKLDTKYTEGTLDAHCLHIKILYV